eukprot:26757-Chlamydomonas_euryale.AAC.3
MGERARARASHSLGGGGGGDGGGKCQVTPYYYRHPNQGSPNRPSMVGSSAPNTGRRRVAALTTRCGGSPSAGRHRRDELGAFRPRGEAVGVWPRPRAPSKTACTRVLCSTAASVSKCGAGIGGLGLWGMGAVAAAMRRSPGRWPGWAAQTALAKTTAWDRVRLPEPSDSDRHALCSYQIVNPGAP